MATTALHAAATGLNALSTEIDVIANNLANVNTDGFKSSRVNFEDLMYEHRKEPGVENALGDPTPAGLQVGLGVQVSNTQLNFEQGSAKPTGRQLDFLIDGNGFFQVEIPQNTGGGVGYTRAGNFFVNSEGELVLGNSNGPRIIPGITFDEDVVSISLAQDGNIAVTTLDDPTPQNVAQLQLATFVNKQGLKAIGKNLYIESGASGPPIVGNPGDGSLGNVLQGHLETSNVDPIRELVDLIKTQRAFELNSQTIQAADETLQVVGNLRRF